ncbi:phosphate ABC transporter permease PstA [Haloimpatiens sp. FM7315]|uniref:phosphate ABC transporter permease PstA n=1 Tax=Haloimpatiens sp. FM7315 TaxID=3298609 RepID=UPI0035A389CC
MDSKVKDKIWTRTLYAISISVVLLLVLMVGYIFYQGRGFLNPSFLFGEPKIVEVGSGIGPQLFNSFYMLVVSLLITVPIGVGAGVYLAEYAKEGVFLNIIRLSIEAISSLPSIVVGLFGLLVFVNLTKWGFTLFSGALAVAILNLPTITRVSENAISSVSKTIKEGSIALGATKFQTIWRVVLPAALSQIITGIILISGRIFGEAAALLYTSGMSAPTLDFSAKSIFSSNSPFNIFRPAETLSVHIWKLNSEGMVPDATSIANKSSAVLIIMVLIFNILARILGKKIQEKYTGTK